MTLLATLRRVMSVRRARAVVAVALGPVLAASGAVLPAVPAVAVAAGVTAAATAASVATAASAHAQSGQPVLVLVQNGETNAPETALLQAAGYSVTQATPSAWAGLSTAQFEGYAALVIGDPSAGGSCSSLLPTTGTSGSDALGTAWQAAVNGNVAVLGTAPALPGTTAANSLITDSAGYAAAGWNSANSGGNTSGTGLYVSLNCEYATAAAGTDVSLLDGVEGIGTDGGLTVQGKLACSDPGTVNTWEAAKAGTFTGFSSSDLAPSAWGTACPVQEAFGSWPAMFTPVAYDAASDATANFTASDGTAGQPYVLLGTPISSATAALAPSEGGEVLGGTTSGGTSNPAAPGVNQAAAGDPVNTENGDFAQSSTDLSLPGFGPQLSFTRTYDAQQAQLQTQTGVPGPLGYGWTDNWTTSLSTARPTPGDIYAADGLRLDSGDGGLAVNSLADSPEGVYWDSSTGDVYFADTVDNRIQEIPAFSESKWGISNMVGGDVYTVAGQADGQEELPLEGGHGNGLPATSIVLNNPRGITMDPEGDLIIADSGFQDVVEIAATSHTQWGISMTAGDAYVIAGQLGQGGLSGLGGPATSAELEDPTSVHMGAGSGVNDLYIADGFGNRILVMPGENESAEWGQSGSWTNGYLYQVAGDGAAGDCGNGKAATGACLSDPQGVTISGSNMYIADTQNCRIEELPGASNSGQWGVGTSMTEGDLYTVAGGSCGTDSNGAKAIGNHLSDPTAVRDPNGNLYITDAGNNDIVEVAGGSHSEWGISMTANDLYSINGWAGPSNLSDLWVDSSGDIYVAVAAWNSVWELTPANPESGTMLAGGATGQNGPGVNYLTLTDAGDSGAAVNASLRAPTATTTDSHGDVYIADAGNDRVQEIAAYGHTQFGITMQAGDTYTIASSTGGAADTNPAAELADPVGLAVSSSGNVYIADSGTYTVDMLDPAGNLTVFAGTYGESNEFTGNGTAATSAVLGTPSALAVDSAGDVFIADSGNNQVLEVPATTTSQMTAGDIYVVAGASATIPSGLTVTGVTSSSVSLSWTASTGTVTGYAVYVNGGTTPAVTTSGTGTTATVTGLTPSTTYTITVAAIGSGGSPGPQSSSVQATTGTLPPGAPTGLTVTSTTDSSVSLSWTAPSGTVTGYYVYENGGSTSVATSTSTSATVTGLSASTNYTFTVAAYNSGGTGTQSSSVPATTAPAPPAAPTGLTVTGTTSSSVSLSWTAPSGTVSGYYVYEVTEEFGVIISQTQVGSVTGTTATVSGLSAKTSYIFDVAAWNAGGTGSYSATVSATTSSTSKPAAPTGLTVTGTTSSSVSLSWTAPSGTVTGYYVYENGGSTSVATSTTTSVTVTGLTASTNYTFTVAAYNSAGTGTQSSSVSATTSAGGGTKPAAPTNLTVTGTTSSSVSLSWTAPSGTVTGYYVYDEECEFLCEGSLTQVASVTGTTATVTGLATDAEYLFAVAAYNSAGTGPQSGDVEVPTGSGGEVVRAESGTVALLATPADLSATPVSDGTVKLAWAKAASTKFNGYYVYENDDEITTIPSAGATSVTVSGLAPATKYTFSVAEYNGAATGAQSSPATVTTAASSAASSSAKGTALEEGGTGDPSGYAGNGGPATAALLDAPAGLAIDAAGDIYVSDSGNNQVREIAAATGTQHGQAMTARDIYAVAGNSTTTVTGAPCPTAGANGDGGPAVCATLSDPQQIAVDQAGDVYITDSGNAVIREVPAASGAQWAQSMTIGDIYDIVGVDGSDGAGDTTGDGSPAATAFMFLPYGISTDPYGDLFILQQGGGLNGLLPQLQEVAASATLSIPAGTGQTSSLYPLDTPGGGGGITITQPGDSQVTFYAQLPTGGCPSGYNQADGYCLSEEFLGATLTSNGSGNWVYTPTPGDDSYIYPQGGGQMTAETDPVGETLTIAQDTPAPGAGQCPSTASSCQTITAASGRALVVGSTNNLITSVTDPMGRTWTYQYNSADQLISVTDPMSRVTSYTYGSGGNANQDLANDLLTITSPDAQPGGPDAGDSTVNVYDNLGRVTSQTDPMGWKTTFNYCVNRAAGDCMNPATGTGYVTVTDPDNNTTVDDYDDGTLAAETHLTVGTVTSERDYNPLTTAGGNDGGTLLEASQTDGNGNTTTFTYDADGDLTSATTPGPDGPATTTAGFNNQDQENCDGTVNATATATCSQDGGPAPVAPGGVITPPSSVPPVGLTYELDDTDGNQLYSTTGVYEPGASSAAYAQTSYQLFNGNSITLNGASISCTSKAPTQSLPCASINPNGVVTQLGYDAAGDVTSTSTPDGNGSENALTTYVYDADGEQTSTTAPDGNVSGGNAGNYTTVTAYNADGQKTSVTQAGGPGATVTPRTTSYGYDADSNQTTVTDARDHATTYTYNADDKLTLVTDPDGNATLTCYDGDGTAAQTVPAAGVSASNLTPASCPASYPSGFSERLAADATVYTFNATGQQTQVTSPAPAGQSGYETTTFTYDGNGNLVQTTAPSAATGGPAQVTVDTYNNANELASETTGYGSSAPSTTTYCYDLDGEQTAAVAPDGNVSGAAPCETSSPWTLNPATNPAQAAYQTTEAYDSQGEAVSTTGPPTVAAPNGATTITTYDPVGNKLTSTAPDGTITTWTYTPQNEIASISYSGGSAHAVAYTYDANGTETGMSDATGTSGYVYDPFGELTSATNGAGQAVTYSYDADADVTGIGYPLPSTATWATSSTVSYGYDNADRLTSVTDFNGNKIAIADTPDGIPSSEALGSSGDTVTYSYDNTDAPSAITLSNSSTTLQSFGYSDAPAGNILSETDTPSSSQSPAGYTYDAQSRVASMTAGSASPVSYGYDASGALTTLPTGAAATYDHAGELTSSVLSGVTTSYTYNADGDQLAAAQGSTTLSSGTWNGAGQLTAFSNSAAAMTAAAYNGNGLRASSASTPAGGGTDTEGYVWDTTKQTPQLLMDSANAYVYAGGNTPAEQISLATGTVTYLVTDSLGSVRGLVSASGALTGTTNYDAWGNPENAGGLTAVTPFGFAGGYTDPSGLIYLISRYYDPATGQFLSVDPVLGQEQPYQYAADNPVTGTDPTGECPCIRSGGESAPGPAPAGQPLIAASGRRYYYQNEAHAAAVDGATYLIWVQLHALGYSWAEIILGTELERPVPVPGGKYKTGEGFADITFMQRNGQLLVWEVKSASTGSDAFWEAFDYALAYHFAGQSAMIGFPVQGTILLPVTKGGQPINPTLCVVVNYPTMPAGGGVLYTRVPGCKLPTPWWDRIPVKVIIRAAKWILAGLTVVGVTAWGLLQQGLNEGMPIPAG